VVGDLGDRRVRMLVVPDGILDRLALGARDDAVVRGIALVGQYVLVSVGFSTVLSTSASGT
jgi:hydrogenase maturation factor